MNNVSPDSVVTVVLFKKQGKKSFLLLIYEKSKQNQNYFEIVKTFRDFVSCAQLRIRGDNVQFGGEKNSIKQET